jgi:hypothetical protein
MVRHPEAFPVDRRPCYHVSYASCSLFAGQPIDVAALQAEGDRVGVFRADAVVVTTA